MFLVSLDEGTANRIEDIAEVELSAVDAYDVQDPLDVRVQDNGNPVLVGILVVELSVSDHHIPLTRASLDDRLRTLFASTFLGDFGPLWNRVLLPSIRGFALNYLFDIHL